MISGSLTKKNGYWYMILRVRDEAGKSKPKWLATHLRADGNKRKAEEMLWAARRDYTDLWEMQKRNFGILFSHYLVSWVKNFHGKVSVGTYTEYQKCIQNRIAPYFEERRIELAKLKSSDILDYYHFLYGKGLTGNTVLHYHVLLRKALGGGQITGLDYGKSNGPYSPSEKRAIHFRLLFSRRMSKTAQCDPGSSLGTADCFCRLIWTAAQ